MKKENNIRCYTSPYCKTIELDARAYCVTAASDTKGGESGEGNIDPWGEPIEG